MTTKRWLVALVQSLLIAWGLLYLATILDLRFVREAGGHLASTASLARCPAPI